MLVLVRHGESTSNAAGRLLGRSDAPLTALGQRQAVAAARAVDRFGAVRSSPLRRAVDTAAAFVEHDQLTIDDRWIEVDYGELEGRQLRDVPPEVWHAWRSDPTFRPDGGESLAEVAQRVADACEELLGPHGPARADDEDVVVVSHVSPIKAAVAWALGADATLSAKLHLSNGSLTRIGWGAAGPVLHTYNEVPALGTSLTAHPTTPGPPVRNR